MSIDVPEIARILGGERILHRRLQTLEDLRATVENGLPVAALEATVRYLAGEGADANDLKHSIVPRITLQRRRTRLSPEESQRLERIARMTALAEKVWGDRALAREFLAGAQPQLQGERPIHLARSDLGTRQVEALLFKLEYSLPA